MEIIYTDPEARPIKKIQIHGLTVEAKVGSYGDRVVSLTDSMGNNFFMIPEGVLPKLIEALQLLHKYGDFN